MLGDKISKYKVIAQIYDTYHIIPLSEPIPANLLDIEGIEHLVRENALPREVATVIYKIMLIGE